MAITRSQRGGSVAEQQLAPARRTRKNLSVPLKASNPNGVKRRKKIKQFFSPKGSNIKQLSQVYVDAAVQTDVNMLNFPVMSATPSRINISIDLPATPSSNKRRHDDSEEPLDQPVVKRVQQTPPNNNNSSETNETASNIPFFRKVGTPFNARTAPQMRRHQTPHSQPSSLTPRTATRTFIRSSRVGSRVPIHANLFDAPDYLRPTDLDSNNEQDTSENEKVKCRTPPTPRNETNNTVSSVSSGKVPTTPSRGGIFGSLGSMAKSGLGFIFRGTPSHNSDSSMRSQRQGYENKNRRHEDESTELEIYQGEDNQENEDSPQTVKHHKNIFSLSEEQTTPSKYTSSSATRPQARKSNARQRSGESPRQSQSNTTPANMTTDGHNDDFETTETLGSKKRKLAPVNGQAPRPKTAGFGIDDSYLDLDNHVEGVDESMFDEGKVMATPPAKKQKTLLPQTPRSVLKKPSIDGTISRSTKKVEWPDNPVTGTQNWAPYGRAGQYNGNHFTAPGDTSLGSSTLSTMSPSQFLSPDTAQNTMLNTPGFNTNVRDPLDPSWRPSPANPRPGQFCLPDDSDDEDTSMMSTTGEEMTSQPPSTPRMSHAELPKPSAVSDEDLNDVSFNTDSIASESTNIQLMRERAKAQKHQPRTSSRLSEVTPARSRSSSPPLGGLAHSDEDTTSTLTTLGSTPSNTHDSASSPGNALSGPTGSASDPTAVSDNVTRAQTTSSSSKTATKAPTLDRINRGSDGMTAYDREHQYDSWASDPSSFGPWPTPQTYEESGVATEYISELIKRNWSSRDSELSEQFWNREFDEVDKLMDEAKRNGGRLELVTG